MKIVPHSFLVVVFFGLAIPGYGQEKLPEETPYYPLKKGMTWTYKVGDKTSTVTVTGFEKVTDVLCARLETKRGDATVTEMVTVKKDGVYRYKYASSEATKPLRFLQLPIKAGDKWNVDSEIAGVKVEGAFTLGMEAEVKLSDKTFKDVVTVKSSDLKIDDKDMSVTYYFAKDVGMIKQEVVISGARTVVELIKHDVPK